MASDSALPPVIGAIADDRDGNALGTVTTVFLDDVTEQPTWVGLSAGLHAAPDDVPVIAPLADARYADGRLQLDVPAEAVRAAPRVSSPDRLSPDEEATLLAHYRSLAPPAAGAPQRTTTLPPVPPSANGQPTGPTVGTAADTAMTVTEERLAVSTVMEPWTRAVLRIEEVTEEVMVPVTITRQQARIEYLPVGPSVGGRGPEDAAEAGARRPTSASEWVTLYAEQPSVTLERRPVERVRLATAWATEETTVTEELRKEQVELTTTTTPTG
ncbi:YsnF/AvaK domain-containing protein [Modestobacter versicolor]|uniref:YsnF/AvaK domain-containing protein n=1 Tax=Modestobacter versicolor TaxID=429133 RepID=UPI0034E005D0